MLMWGGNPVGYVDPFGLSPKDVEDIRKAFDKAVRDMTDNGLRLPNPTVNNWCRKYPFSPGCENPNKLKDCGEQTEYTNEQLQNLNLEDDWYFGMNAGFGHAWGIATSSNPEDPVLHYDPRANQFSDDGPCPACSGWFGDSTYNDNNPYPHPPYKP